MISLQVIENVARVLEVDLKDLFDFGHLDPEATAPEGLVKDISSLDEHDRQLLRRMVSMMAR